MRRAMRAFDSPVRRGDAARPISGLDPKGIVAISEALTAILARIVIVKTSKPSPSM